MRQVTPDLLARCVDEIIDHQVSLDACLTAHAEVSAELRSLLETALAIPALPDVTLPPAARSRMRSTILSAIAETAERNRPVRSVGSHWLSNWASRVALPGFIAAMAAGLLLFGGAHAVDAARDSLPGDALYPVKQLVETVQVVLSPDDVSRADTYLTLAERRLGELEKARQIGRNEAAAAAAHLVDEDLDQAGELLSTVASPAANVTALRHRLAADRAARGQVERASAAATRDALPTAGQTAGEGSPKLTGAPTSAVSSPDHQDGSSALLLPHPPSGDRGGATAYPNGSVLDPLLADLSGLRSRGVISSQTGDSLAAKLQAARAAIQRDQPNAAIGDLDAFLQELNGLLRSGHLEAETYLAIYPHYATAIQLLGGTPTPPQVTDGSDHAPSQPAHPAATPVGGPPPHASPASTPSPGAPGGKGRRTD